MNNDVNVIEYECPHCQKMLQIPNQYAGQNGSCTQCRGAITVPDDITANTEMRTKKSRKPMLGALVAFIAVAAIFAVIYTNDQSPQKKWAIADEAGTISAYEGFLTDHEDSDFAENAKQKIEALDWNDASSANTVIAYNAFLKSHPASPHEAEVRENIESIEWDTATNSNTLSSYRVFLDKYKASEKASIAMNRMLSLSWKETVSKNSLEGYEEFLENYPESEHEATALEKITDLKWKFAKEILLSNINDIVLNYINNSETSKFSLEISKLESVSGPGDAKYIRSGGYGISGGGLRVIDPGSKLILTFGKEEEIKITAIADGSNKYAKIESLEFTNGAKIVTSRGIQFIYDGKNWNTPNKSLTSNKEERQNEASSSSFINERKNIETEKFITDSTPDKFNENQYVVIKDPKLNFTVEGLSGFFGMTNDGKRYMPNGTFSKFLLNNKEIDTKEKSINSNIIDTVDFGKLEISFESLDGRIQVLATRAQIKALEEF